MAESPGALADALRERYVLERELGRGGMATVYLARDLKHKRHVALKVLDPELGAVLGVERFLREIETAAQLQHPHILPVFDSGEVAGRLWYTMPFVEGETLRDRLRRQGRLTIEEALRLGQQIADALEAAHERGVVHRDIKPENVLLSHGHALVADFGIARSTRPSEGKALTQTGLSLGTPAYMSPEQALGERDLDGRSDIYALGCLVHELIAGQPPFTGPNAQAVMTKHIAEPVPDLRQVRPEVPPAVATALGRAMAKQPSDRFATAVEFAEALAVCLTAGTTAEGVPPKRHTMSVAVLPLVNRSADPENEYFSDGLSEVLINALSRVKNFRVPARTSAFSFKGQDVDVREVGRTLNVANVLEGSVQKVGSRVRITAELISAHDGYHLWSEQYDRVLADVFDVQDEITRAIVDALKVQLLPGEETAVTRRYTRSVQAYQLYLKGRYFWNQRSTEAYRKAIGHFEAALAEDPSYALAYAGLADAYALLGDGGHTAIPPREAFSKATTAALRALELDDELAEAHTSLGHLRMHEFEWTEAEREFKRAISLNPNYATAHHWYAIYLALRGQSDEAITTIQRALELDPVSRAINTDLGVLFYYGRQLDRAIAQYRATLEIDPGFSRAYVALGSTYAKTGRFDDAIRMYQEAMELSGDRSTVAGLGRAYALAGRKDDALRAIGELQELSKQRYITPYGIALIYACLGMNDEAFDWLERAYQEGVGELIYLKVDPFLDHLRSDRRYTAMLRQIRFEE